MSIAIMQHEEKVKELKSPLIALAGLSRLEPDHLLGLNRIELFAVIAEHWLKCSAAARIHLLCSGDAFIRSEAREQNKAFTQLPCASEQGMGFPCDAYKQVRYLPAYEAD